MKDMQDFNIAKYLREHQLGSYGILNHYVDLKPLNEDDAQDEKYIDNAIFSLIRYNDPNREDKENKIKDNLKNLSSDQISLLKKYGKEYIEYNQAANDPQGAIGTEYGLPNPKLDKDIRDILTKDIKESETMSEEDSMGANRIMDIGGNSIKEAIGRLRDSGFDAEDVINLLGKLMYQYFGKEDVSKLMSQYFGNEDEEDLY